MYKINCIENNDVKEILKKYSTPQKERKNKLIKRIFIIICFMVVAWIGWEYGIDFLKTVWSYISIGFVLIAFLTLSAAISIISFILKLF